mmetsp:Transcript_33441/g.66366  ORF Transcript_33441/g.66366 Transcript_33441/m.66366 type:complete len:320 (+) Transcript_33441:140-1099(+)
MGSGASKGNRSEKRMKSPTAKSIRSLRTAGSNGSVGTSLGLIERMELREKQEREREERERLEREQQQQQQYDCDVVMSTESELFREPVEVRASVRLMSKLIRDAVPKFKSYTIEDPTKSDLDAANDARQLLTEPENYLQFYTTLYKYLYDYGGTGMAFSTRTISFKNGFFLELIKLIVFEGSNKATFSERVRYFGEKHRSSGVHMVDYGVIGEAIVRGMRAVQNSYEDNLWSKVYSRFLRSLIPSMMMIMADADAPSSHQYHHYNSKSLGTTVIATTGLSVSTGLGTGGDAPDSSRLSMTDSLNGMKQHNNSRANSDVE